MNNKYLIELKIYDIVTYKYDCIVFDRSTDLVDKDAIVLYLQKVIDNIDEYIVKDND